MRVSIVGAGYVGLVSGVCLASLGHDVICVDRDADRVRDLNNGICPIHEDGLEDLLRDVVGIRFSATTDLAQAVADTDLTILAVGTPFRENETDLGQIRSAAQEIGKALRTVNRYHVVAVKSTVVPGTTEELVGPALEESSGLRIGPDIGLAMNPEFLREGTAVSDFLEPDRIVIGGLDQSSSDVLARLYSIFPDTTLVRVDPKTAELIKYSSNALFATLISFSNEIGNLSAQIGVDVVDVLAGVRLDRRLSPVIDGVRSSPGILAYLAAGCGFGGSCFPKDVKALIAHGATVGIDMQILRAVNDVNTAQAGVLIDQLRANLDISNSCVTVLGAAFKPGTDDVRESPTLAVVPRLLKEGAKVIVHDPIATVNCRNVLGDEGITYSDDLDEAVSEADAVILVTDWPEYRGLAERLGDRNPIIVDGRRVLLPKHFNRYTGVGYSR